MIMYASGQQISLQKGINISVLVLYLTGTAVFLCGMPGYSDDFWYAGDIIRHGAGDSLQGIFRTISLHFHGDNARIANMVFCFFLLLPKIAGSALASVIWAYSVVAGLKLADIRATSASVLVIPAVFLFSFTLPWYDLTGTECYQFNYVVPTGLSVAFLLIFFERQDSNVLVSIVLSLLTGAWNEAFSIPLLCGCGAAFVTSGRLKSRRNLLMLICLATGICFLMLAPAFRVRLHNVTSANAYTADEFVRVIARNPAFLLMLAAAIVSVFKSGRKSVIFNPINTALWVSAITMSAIHLISSRSAHAGWWTQFASVLVILSVARQFLQDGECWPRWKFLLVAVPGTLLTLSHWVMVDIHALRIRGQMEQALAAFKKNPHETVFLPLTIDLDSPLICTLAPDFTVFLTPFNNELITRYFDNGHSFSVIPSGLEYADIPHSRPIDGNTEIRVSDSGLLFAPTEREKVFEFRADVDFGRIHASDVKIVGYPFVSKADGKRYAFIYPWRRLIEYRLGGTPTRITVNR